MNVDNAVIAALSEDLDEVKALVETLNLKVVGEVLIKSKKIDSSFYLSKSKIALLKKLVEENKVSKVYIYDELKPRQIINLMKELKANVYDRVGLILEIFALHAGSREAKLQIEMLRLKHELPLVKEWVRRAKMGELPGFLGPGGYATDAYYYSMRRRYAKIKGELLSLRERRSLERVKRSSHGFPQIAISGYTNAGKTTLFNALTSENKPVGMGMFTTISPKVKGTFINGRKVIFVDTVGFIRKVPTEVIEAFYATLEEIAESNLTVVLLDSTENLDIIIDKLKTSLEVLSKIGYLGKPIIVALNKIDAVEDVGEAEEKLNAVKKFLDVNYRWRWDVITLSALKQVNIDLLKERIVDFISVS
ncbi:MAG: GTPase HflX [Sulfolobales archaeon]|nr:GTPase HflX [Sulfolobales archaeon]